jgi:hypothetical protein
MSELMLDIETLGTDPGSVVFAIGAVKFDGDGVCDELFTSIRLASAQSAGLEIDADTVGWWIDQSTEAQKQLRGGESLRSALAELKRFATDVETVWACSPAFDCVMLDSAFDAVDMSSPWRFYECRDYRTFRETLSTWPDREQDSVDHNALEDARFQAECLVDAVTASDEVSL